MTLAQQYEEFIMRGFPYENYDELLKHVISRGDSDYGGWHSFSVIFDDCSVWGHSLLRGDGDKYFTRYEK